MRGSPHLASPPRLSFARLALLALALLVLVFLALALLPAALLAQNSTTGALRGILVDPTGALLPNSSILLAEPTTGRTLLLTSAPDGSFSALALTPGIWSAEIRAPGFSPLRLPALTVALGAVTDLHRVTLPVGASEVVTVEATPDDAATAAATSLLTSAEIAHLPLDGRRWQSFARLTPQAGPVDTSLDLLSFRALSPTQNSTSIDGLSADQSYAAAPRGAGQDSGPDAEDETENPNGSGRSAAPGYNSGVGPGRHPGMEYTLPETAVREFRVTAANDSALFGHAAGGTVTTVTRSGTDHLRGSLFFLLRSSLFAAADPSAIATSFHNGLLTSAVVKPHDLREQFGGSLGGPLLPAYGNDGARLVFFDALDIQRRGFPAISSPLNPAFYSLSPAQTALLGNRGVSPTQTVAALNYLSGLTGAAPRRHDQLVNFARLDFLPTPADHLTLAYHRAHSNSPGGGRTAPVVNRAIDSLGNTQVRIDAVTLTWSRILTPRLANELRAQYARDLHRETAQPPLPQEPSISLGNRPPEVVIGPEGLIFGTPTNASGGPNPDERRAELAETLSWSPRHHLLQLGGSVSFVHEHLHATSDLEGAFHYDSGFTNGHAGGLADWITDYTYNVNATPNGGCPSIASPTHLFCFRSFAQSFGGADLRFDTAEFAAFAQDSWRLSRTLTLSAGLRYEYELLPIPQQPNLALDTVFTTLGGATSRFPEDRNNIGPRVGLAWSPFRSRRTTLSVGYGLYFGRLPGATVRAALQNTALPSTVSRIRILPSTETACPQVANQGFGYPCAFVAAPPAGVVSTTTATLFSRRFRLPASQQGRVAVEQLLRPGLTLTLAAQTSLTRQLPNTTDLNIAPATETRSFVLSGGTATPGVADGTSFSLPLYTARVDTAFGPVTEVLSNANAVYNAVTVELNDRLRKTLNLHASYTRSKGIDFGQDAGAIPPTNGQYDPFDVRYDKGLSSLNLPQKTAVFLTWSPAGLPRSRWGHRLAGGWSATPILLVSSGKPYSFDIFGGSRLPGGHESLNGSGGSVYLPTVGRNTLHLPTQIQADLRINRAFSLRDHTTFRLFAEAFNLPNHHNLSAVSTRAFLVGAPVDGIYPLVYQSPAAVSEEGLTASPFGRPLPSSQTEGRERQLQLGLRLDF